MSTVFWKPKTECLYLDGPSQTWYIVHKTAGGISEMAIHHFEPTVYYTAIGAHEPVLHIESGDTVFTTTVD